jgi:hypothetical protein
MIEQQVQQVVGDWSNKLLKLSVKKASAMAQARQQN